MANSDGYSDILLALGRLLNRTPLDQVKTEHGDDVHLLFQYFRYNTRIVLSLLTECYDVTHPDERQSLKVNYDDWSWEDLLNVLKTISYIPIGLWGFDFTMKYLHWNRNIRKIGINHDVPTTNVIKLFEYLNNYESLSHLEIDRNFICAREARSLASFFDGNRTIKHLAISFFNCGGVILSVVVKSLERTFALTQLHFSGVMEPGISGPLGNVLIKNPKISELNLRGVSFPDGSLKLICDGLLSETSQVKTLILDNTNIIMHGMWDEFCGFISKDNTLRTLHLHNCKLEDYHVSLLCTYLERNETLAHLHLNDNHIGYDTLRNSKVYLLVGSRPSEACIYLRPAPSIIGNQFIV